jgi:hypothetical protein
MMQLLLAPATTDYLARAGLRTLVLDQHHMVGGMATTEELTLTGFRSDVPCIRVSVCQSVSGSRGIGIGGLRSRLPVRFGQPSWPGNHHGARPQRRSGHAERLVCLGSLADIGGLINERPLYSIKRTCDASKLMSAKCQKQTLVLFLAGRCEFRTRRTVVCAPVSMQSQ